MQHPFINDLSDKTLEELQTTLSDLTAKLNFAGRMGNRPLMNQILMVIESYKTEYDKKMDEMIDKQKIKTQINIQNESNN
jgi:hypothetical protein